MCMFPQIKDEYTVVLTLTDNKLGEGQFITQSMLLLVEDINDNEPIFRPYESSLAVDENAPPQVLATLLATDQDEGPFGQVNHSSLTLALFRFPPVFQSLYTIFPYLIC